MDEEMILKLLREMPAEQRNAVYAIAAQMGCPQDLLEESIAIVEADC